MAIFNFDIINCSQVAYFKIKKSHFKVKEGLDYQDQDFFNLLKCYNNNQPVIKHDFLKVFGQIGAGQQCRPRGTFSSGSTLFTILSASCLTLLCCKT